MKDVKKALPNPDEWIFAAGKDAQVARACEPEVDDNPKWQYSSQTAPFEHQSKGVLVWCRGHFA
jgi:hypothetical protein